jgi:hypothetical protein
VAVYFPPAGPGVPLTGYSRTTVFAADDGTAYVIVPLTL